MYLHLQESVSQHYQVQNPQPGVEQALEPGGHGPPQFLAQWGRGASVPPQFSHIKSHNNHTKGHWFFLSAPPPVTSNAGEDFLSETTNLTTTIDFWCPPNFRKLVPPLSTAFFWRWNHVADDEPLGGLPAANQWLIVRYAISLSERRVCLSDDTKKAVCNGLTTIIFWHCLIHYVLDVSKVQVSS